MIRKISCLLTILLLFIGSKAAAETSNKEETALSAAQTWLVLVDESAYGESWVSASTLFKDSIKKQTWEESVEAARDPLGPVISRSIKSKTYTASLPDAPDGEYVVIQFSTSFREIKSTTETITMMLDTDGTWRASGYYIK